MRSQRFFAAPGVSLPAIALQSGRANGIEIDNSSGSWLYVPTLETYVPPFTIGWSMDFPYAVTSVDIIAGQNGPAGQISTSQGTGVTVYLYDDKIGRSAGTVDLSARGGGSPAPGVEFIAGFTPTLRADLDLGTSVSAPFNGTLIAAVTGKRIRLLTLNCGYNASAGSPTPMMAPVRFNFNSIPDDLSTSSTVCIVSILPDLPAIFIEWPNGNDLATGKAFTYTISATWADENVRVNCTYQLI